MRTKINENEAFALEKKYPNLLFIQSEEGGFYYATSYDDNRIAIVTVSGTAILTEKQALALAEEIKDMTMFIGRGRK